MYNSKFNRRLALVNVLILVFLCLDTFVLHPTRYLEIFERYETTETLNTEAGTHDYFTNFIHTKSGHRLREPGNSGNTLNWGDTFYVERTNILNRPINLIYKVDHGIETIKSGTLNQGYFGTTIALFIFFVSVINLFPKAIMQRPNLNERLLFSGSAFLIVLIFLYFY